MEDIYLLIGAAALFVIQIACFFIKKIWLRLMPVLVVVACIVFCVAMYILSGCTNWAYLILLALLFFSACRAGDCLGDLRSDMLDKKVQGVKKKYLTSITWHAIMPQVSSDSA